MMRKEKEIPLEIMTREWLFLTNITLCLNLFYQYPIYYVYLPISANISFWIIESSLKGNLWSARGVYSSNAR